MNRRQRSPAATVIAPPTITPARSDTIPIATCRTSPRTEPMYATRAPRRKTRPTLSAPTSSAIQASSAPLVNVYESPQRPQRAMISHGAETMPTSIQVTPMPT